jgi:hypothetical protein
MRRLQALTLMLLTGCTTYQVTPSQHDLVWKNGQGFQTVENQMFSLSGAVDSDERESSSSHQKVFYVEMTNKSKSPVTVGPEMFRLRGPSKSMGPINPEAVIAQTAQDINASESQAQPNFQDFANSTSDLSAAIAGETSKDRQDRLERNNRRALEQNQAATQVLMGRDTLGRWQTKAIRRNTLSGGQKLSGFVAFEFSPEPGPLYLDFVTPGSTLSLGFQVSEK